MLLRKILVTTVFFMSSFIDFLSFYDVLFLHERIIKRFGGLHGLRDLDLLESAISQPQILSQGSVKNKRVRESFLPVFSILSYDEYLNKDIFHMAATYVWQIIISNPFIDGNKRTGILASIIFLEKNGLITHVNPEELYYLALNISEAKISREEVAQFFKVNMS